ncbi:hypothetical protein ASPZODRAFT_126521 [Penicilliopsis zonata CBS 506.65]|uniref:Glutamine amidotransferase domain-containing protein n=1 Tax=Penicilliopsis zonata CBS 506.65 TaxID=1073090 RepID=A0A1L9STT2_9EURO|nr:hypothetical protein ASPZODRAFT_126521 [Penicilliopsis zonata CBS 506.65]OJJ50625.1 hypothetical protein ASPZODRAFT_126521 [Penicilliopsis zonata CBS 506.65]
MPSKPLHIAVLECDTPVDPVREKLQGYGDIFERLLQTGFQSLGQDAADIELKVSKWDVVNHEVYPTPEEVDALLLTGSKHNSFENDSWIVNLTSYVKDVIEIHQKPVVGICFGHQIIARALGSRVARNTKGWEISVEKFALTDQGKELFGKDELALHQMHRDIVYDLPPDCINLGFSPVCEIQGFYRPKKIITVQAHPEFTEFIVSQILELRHGQKIFDDALYESGISRVANPHDGLLVASAICRFLLGL